MYLSTSSKSTVTTLTQVTISCLDYSNGLLIDLHASSSVPFWFYKSESLLNVGIIFKCKYHSTSYLLNISQCFFTVLKIQASCQTSKPHIIWFQPPMSLAISITSSKATSPPSGTHYSPAVFGTLHFLRCRKLIPTGSSNQLFPVSALFCLAVWLSPSHPSTLRLYISSLRGPPWSAILKGSAFYSPSQNSVSFKYINWFIITHLFVCLTVCLSSSARL